MNLAFNIALALVHRGLWQCPRCPLELKAIWVSCSAGQHKSGALLHSIIATTSIDEKTSEWADLRVFDVVQDAKQVLRRPSFCLVEWTVDWAAQYVI